MTQATVWMPFYWGDYLAETGHLSTEEHGAYVLLIGAYWQAGGPLVDDDRRLARITRLSLRRWKVVRKTLVEFFTITDQKWHLRRVDDELSETKKRRLNRVEGRKKRQGLAGNNQQNQCQNPVNSGSSQAEHSPYVRASPPPPPQNKKEEQVCSSQKNLPAKDHSHDQNSPHKTRGRKTRATRLPHDWRPEPADLCFARDRGFTPDQTRELVAGFCDYWWAKPDGVKLDWAATWRNWIRNAVIFGEKNAPKKQTVEGFARAAAEVAARMEQNSRQSTH